MPKEREPSNVPRPAVLVALHLPEQDEHEVEISLAELRHLLRGLHITALHVLVQRRADPRTPLGEGKRKELAELLRAHEEAYGETPLVVFDGELGARPTHRLEDELKAEVIDRTGVILRVFEQRAGSDVAKLEVTLARLQHELPRARVIESESKRSGGGGGRGELGNTRVELRKQQLRQRIAEVRRDLDRALAARDAQRARRAELPVVGLVGYTNAGKSSLLRALTGSDVLVADQLFATLGTTVRALSPPSRPRVLMADTVGFLRRLPNELLASFRSTLAEACAADLLLLVVDASDPEWREHLRVTRETLAAVDAGGVPSRVVLNKVDRLDEAARAALREELPGALQASAHDPEGVRRVRHFLLDALDEDSAQELLRVPFREGALLAEIREQARVGKEAFDEEGAVLSVRARPHDLERWRRRLPPAPPLEAPADVLAAAAAHGLELVTEQERFDTTGLDFLVVHAQDAEGAPWIVRTPRRPEVYSSSVVESRALRLVRPRLPVAVPDWRLCAREVIAYPRLPGVPAVTVAEGAPTWHVIEPTALPERFLATVAETLAALQAIPAEEAAAVGVPVVPIDEARERFRQDLERTREALAPSATTLARWQRWLDDETRWPPHLALVHGDLHPGHMLLAADGALTGVLDWTEARVTDPSVDLALFFGCFGRDALEDLLERFERAGGRRWSGDAAHAAERWAASPVAGAAWGLDAGNDAVVGQARQHLRTLEEAG